MFAFIHQHERGAESLVGGSWLYHVEAYRRLFPPAFLATAKPGGEDYAYMTLWGQFLDRNGRVREEAAMRFNGCLDRQDTLEGVLACFPLTVLYLEASIEEYYRFYGIRQ
jgi:hypothetical protein